MDIDYQDAITLSPRIQKLKESGILDMWLQNEIVNTSQCLKPPSSDRSSQDISALDLESFFGPMLVLVAGERGREGKGR